MNVLQTLKFYYPSKGGTESIVKNLIEGIIEIEPEHFFNVYVNSHFPQLKTTIQVNSNIKIIKESTPVLFKSQPLNFAYNRLKGLIAESDVIHHHYPFPNMELALNRNRTLLKNKKFVITWHANVKNSRWHRLQKYYDPLVHKLLDRADHIVVTSPQLLASSHILGKYEKKVEVIPLSFAPEFENPVSAAKALPADRPFTVLFVGKLRKYKGLQYLVQAVVNLPVNLVIVGDGEEEAALKAQVETLNLTKRVVFRQNLTNEQLAEVYRQADAFALPSINEAEAFGVVQLEAMASGLPVINTKLDSGVPYVSIDGLTGYTVEPMNAEALSGAISNLMNAPEQYKQFSANAMERAQLFTRAKLVESYLKLYKL